MERDGISGMAVRQAKILAYTGYIHGYWIVVRSCVGGGGAAPVGGGGGAAPVGGGGSPIIVTLCSGTQTAGIGDELGGSNIMND